MHRRLEAELGSERVLLTHSCTARSRWLCCSPSRPRRRGDPSVVRVPFTAERCRAARRRAVFVDIRADTLNLDETSRRRRDHDRTRGLAPIDYAGVGCEMDAFLALAREHGLVVIEDAAQGYGASYRGRPLGALPISPASASTRRRT